MKFSCLSKKLRNFVLPALRSLVSILLFYDRRRCGNSLGLRHRFDKPDVFGQQA